jgi:hypothetical protein
MAPFIAIVTMSEGGGNAVELKRGEVGHDLVKEVARPVQFLTMAWEVGGGLARRGDARWATARSASARKEKGERGGSGLVGQLACWVGSGRWARWPMGR